MCAAEKKKKGLFIPGTASRIFSIGILVRVTAHKSVVNHMNCCISREIIDGSLPPDLFNVESDKTPRTHTMLGLST